MLLIGCLELARIRFSYIQFFCFKTMSVNNAHNCFESPPPSWLHNIAKFTQSMQSWTVFQAFQCICQTRNDPHQRRDTQLIRWRRKSQFHFMASGWLTLSLLDIWAGRQCWGHTLLVMQTITTARINAFSSYGMHDQVEDKRPSEHKASHWKPVTFCLLTEIYFHILFQHSPA